MIPSNKRAQEAGRESLKWRASNPRRTVLTALTSPTALTYAHKTINYLLACPTRY